MSRMPNQLRRLTYRLACELLEIGISEGFTNQELRPGVGFTPRGKHMRTLQIGLILNEIGGLYLMVATAIFIRDQLDFQRMKSLGACWSGIGKW